MKKYITCALAISLLLAVPIYSYADDNKKESQEQTKKESKKTCEGGKCKKDPLKR